MTDFWTEHGADILLWGLLASCAMACVQEGTQALGFSRMSFPFLIGSFFTDDRRKAQWLGFLCYMTGGWLFAAFYLYLFLRLGGPSALLGGILGLAQGMFMLLILLPLLPFIHPRMITPYDGPSILRRIEPPGFMALHYGPRAPAIHLLGQVVFGVMLGILY